MSALNTVWAWVLAHITVVSTVVVMFLDFLITKNPAWKSNGIFEAVYNFFVSKKGPVTPPSA